MSQKGTAKFLYHLTMGKSRKLIKQKYGKYFWDSFKNLSDKRFGELISEFQYIGDSMFAFNYSMQQTLIFLMHHRQSMLVDTEISWAKKAISLPALRTHYQKTLSSYHIQSS